MKFSQYLLTEQSLEDLTEKLGSLGFHNLKSISNKTIAVLTSRNRMEVIKELEKALPGRYIPKPTYSSIGYIDYDNFNIIVKPLKRQGIKSSGIENEHMFIDMIETMLHMNDTLTPLTIKFIGHNKNFEVKDVVEIKDVISINRVGAFTANRKKADVLLKTKSGRQIPISIKRDDSEHWESVDRYWSHEAKKYIDAQIKEKNIKLTKEEDYYKIYPSIAILATTQESNDIIFGADISPDGAVIIKTFSSDDFKIENNVVKVYVTYVIRSLEDLPDSKEVYFMIRNDKSRNTTGFYPGLRVTAVTKNRINKTNRIIER